MNKEYYQILGVDQNANASQLKNAYKKLAVIHHPDKGGDVEMFKKINNAYDTLSDPDKRRIYDHEGMFAEQLGRSPGTRGAHYNPFPSFFGMSFFHDHQPPHKATKTKQKFVHRIDISLENACKGVEKKIVISINSNCPKCKNKCSQCQGEGTTVQNMVHVIRHQQFVRSRMVTCSVCNGAGIQPISPSASSCDVCQSKGHIEQKHHVTVTVPPNTFADFKKVVHQNEHMIELIIHIIFPHNFQRNGNDLLYIHTIKLTDCLLGPNIRFQHPSGETIEIDKTIHRDTITPETVLTVRNKGVLPNTHLQVKFDIRFPVPKQGLSDEDRKDAYTSIQDVFSKFFDESKK
jgi:DnaJ family protein A protein 2